VAAVDRLSQEISTFVRALHALKTCVPSVAQDRSSLLLLPRLQVGSCRLRTLADAVHADPSTVSRQVSELVDLGLVRREADPRDGRATLLARTPAGRNACEELLQRRRSVVQSLLAEWPVERVASLTDLLHAFSHEVEALTRDDPTGRAARTVQEQDAGNGEEEDRALVGAAERGAGDGTRTMEETS
jgi:DNA-binding MarR family transcriptional regulator